MDGEIKMSVSSVTQNKGNSVIYVLFEDGNRKAEFVLPDNALVKNTGFSKEETEGLEEYIKKEKTAIYELAKKVDVMNAFMKKRS